MKVAAVVSSVNHSLCHNGSSPILPFLLSNGLDDPDPAGHLQPAIQSDDVRLKPSIEGAFLEAVGPDDG